MKNGLGLDAKKVELVPHDNLWGKAFEKESKKLRSIFGSFHTNIEHIGSTAIQGMPAKPILDIALGIPAMDAPNKLRSTKLLEKAGYKKIQFFNPTFHLFFIKGPLSNCTHHLHLIKHRGKKWTDYLFFRDFLNKNKKARQEYLQLKTSLAHEFSGNRRLYTRSKGQFVKNINARRS
jgi:GrpB-like predicted nucleotidyltransferase (UPF0157 family)